MEKDLSVKFLETSGGFPKTPYSVFFLLAPVDALDEDAAVRHLLLASGEDKVATETAESFSPSHTPSLPSSPSESAGRTDKREGIPTAAVICRRRPTSPSLAVPSIQEASPSPSPQPRRRNCAGMP